MSIITISKGVFDITKLINKRLLLSFPPPTWCLRLPHPHIFSRSRTMSNSRSLPPICRSRIIPPHSLHSTRLPPNTPPSPLLPRYEDLKPPTSPTPKPPVPPSAAPPPSPPSPTAAAPAAAPVAKEEVKEVVVVAAAAGTATTAAAAVAVAVEETTPVVTAAAAAAAPAAAGSEKKAAGKEEQKLQLLWPWQVSDFVSSLAAACALCQLTLKGHFLGALYCSSLELPGGRRVRGHHPPSAILSWLLVEPPQT